MSHNTKSGVAHFAADDEDACLEDARYLLSFLPQNNLETPPRVQPTDDPLRMDASSTRSSPTARTSPTTCATSSATWSTTASSSRSTSTTRRTSSAASRG